MSVETREMKEIEAAVEGILFASGEPVHIAVSYTHLTLPTT